MHSELPLSDGVIAIIGKFDYIETSGVLHHLPDPVSGLTSLSKVLKPNGCIGIMVYGLYGRRATYMLQDILKSTAKALDVSIRDEQMRDIARDILSGDTLYKNHPVNNDFKLSKTSDITQMGDAGLVDLFFFDFLNSWLFIVYIHIVCTCIHTHAQTNRFVYTFIYIHTSTNSHSEINQRFGVFRYCDI